MTCSIKCLVLCRQISKCLTPGMVSSFMVSLSEEIIFKCLDVTEVNSASFSSPSLYKLILLRLIVTIMRLFDVAATVHILSYIVSAAFIYHNTIFQGRNLFRIDPIKAFH